MRFVGLGLCLALAAAGCGYGVDSGPQGEMNFAVKNVLQAPRYVDWVSGGNGLVSCRDEAIGEGCRFHPSWCSVECTAENLNQPCCVDCAGGYPAVKVIGTDETLLIHWSGKLYPNDWDHCSDCDCYRVENPAPGAYRAEIFVYDDWQCDFEPCSGPDAEGIITGASPAGEEATYGADFTVPYKQPLLYLLSD